MGVLILSHREHSAEQTQNQLQRPGPELWPRLESKSLVFFGLLGVPNSSNRRKSIGEKKNYFNQL